MIYLDKSDKIIIGFAFVSKTCFAECTGISKLHIMTL